MQHILNLCSKAVASEQAELEPILAELKVALNEQSHESEFRLLADSIPELCWMAHGNGDIFWYNQRWYEYTGTTFQQMEGWGWQSVHDPKVLPSVLERWKSALMTGQSFEMEFPLRGADGVFRWFLTRISPFRNAEGKVVRWFGTNTNIHQQQELRQSLIEARDQLEHRVKERTAELERKRADSLQKAILLDLVNDAIFMRDIESRISYWNQGAERLYGWTSVEAVGRQSHDLLGTEFPLPVEEIQSKKYWDGELRQKKRDGTEIVVASRWTTLRDAEGKPAGWLEINTDITERKRAEQTARGLAARFLTVEDAERRKFARELHDGLGQYLTALKLSLSLLPSTDEKQATMISECSNILDKCISETRSVSHLLHPPLLDEAGLESAIRWNVEALAQRSGIAVKLDLPPKGQRLHTEVETALFRVVQEALSNIYRHANATEVGIQLQSLAKEVRLEIRDNGRGIPKDRLIQLRSGTGTGLGLVGIRERVRELGGTLQIESNEIGTVLKISIPLVKPIEPAVSEPSIASNEVA